MMSNTLLESVVKKNRARLIPFMLALYVLAFLDRSNIGFAKETYQLDTGLSNEAYALGAGIFFVVYAFLGVPANLLMRKFGARRWIGCTTLLWGVLSAAMAWADTEAKFLLVRTLLGAAEAGFFPGMIYLTSQWFPQQNRASIMGLFYMGAPLALTLGSPLSGALLEDGQAEETPAACTCAEKCQAGAVNTACPVCAVNMSECAGKAPEVEPEPEPEPEKESGNGGALVLILLLAALGGGGAFAYIKFIKPKQGAKVSADPDDYEFEDEEYENEDVPEQGEQEDQN